MGSFGASSNMLTVVDLFAGAGGTARGFLDAGFKIVGAVDNDPNANLTYTKNIGVIPKPLDLLKVEATTFRKALGLGRKRVDVLVGCPPCQGFTHLRFEGVEADQRNDLVVRFADFAEALNPKCVVFENVPGLLNRTHGQKLFEQLKNRLHAQGYKTSYGILNATDYGVAQFRRRVVMIGWKGNLTPILPPPTHADPNSYEVTTNGLSAWNTVEIIRTLPSLNPGEQSSDVPNHVARRFGQRLMEFIELVPKNGGSRTDVPEKYWLDCHKKAGCGHGDVYGRLHWERPSGTLTSGCTNASKGRFVHPEQNRSLTPREAARLQSFDDQYQFTGSLDSISKQIGNAVPPLLAKAVAIQVKQLFKND